jgi:hypothetical protein
VSALARKSRGSWNRKPCSEEGGAPPALAMQQQLQQLWRRAVVRVCACVKRGVVGLCVLGGDGWLLIEKKSGVISQQRSSHLVTRHSCASAFERPQQPSLAEIWPGQPIDCTPDTCTVYQAPC